MAGKCGREEKDEDMHIPKLGEKSYNYSEKELERRPDS